jgi:hypothetical protein
MQLLSYAYGSHMGDPFMITVNINDGCTLQDVIRSNNAMHAVRVFKHPVALMYLQCITMIKYRIRNSGQSVSGFIL